MGCRHCLDESFKNSLIVGALTIWEGRAERPVPVWLGEEVQEVLRRGDGELTRTPNSSNGSSPTRSAIIEAEEVAVMKSRQGYKGYVIVALNRLILTAETQKDGLQKDGLSFIRFRGESCRRKESSLLGGDPCRGSLSERASKQYDSVYPTFWELLQPRL